MGQQPPRGRVRGVGQREVRADRLVRQRDDGAHAVLLAQHGAGLIEFAVDALPKPFTQYIEHVAAPPDEPPVAVTAPAPGTAMVERLVALFSPAPAAA